MNFVFRGLDLVLIIVEWVVLVWVILSWIVFFLHNSKFRWRHRRLYDALEALNYRLGKVTAPLLRPIRRFLRRFETRGIDWSPMVLWLIILLLRKLLFALQLRLYTPSVTP